MWLLPALQVQHCLTPVSNAVCERTIYLLVEPFSGSIGGILDAGGPEVPGFGGKSGGSLIFECVVEDVVCGSAKVRSRPLNYL